MISTFAVLGLSIIVFIWNKVSPALVALGVALALYFAGAVSFEQAIAGFGDPIVVYLAGLFVVSDALEATGITAWAGSQLAGKVGEKRSRVVIALMLLSAGLTALISVNGAVAALVPVAAMLATRTGQPPSKVLIPLAFAAHAGSMLTLLGTPINVLVSELSVQAGGRPFGFFEFALVGIPLLTGTILLCLFLGPKLLPAHASSSAPRDLSRHVQTLAAAYGLDEDSSKVSYSDGITEVLIPPRSEFIGDIVFPGMLTESKQLVVSAIHRQGEALGRAKLQAGDVLVLRGGWDAVEAKAAHPGVLPVDSPEQVRRQAVVLGPRSYVAAAVLVLMCVVLATGLVPAAITVLAAAGVLVLARTLSVEQAQRSISLPTLVIVAGMIPLSTAIQTSGAAEVIAAGLMKYLGGSSPRIMLLGIVIVVMLLGQFISNLATVLIVAPIAVAVAQSTGVSPMPMMMAITVAGAASFLTPVATAGNLMIQEPGGYSFGDYWKLGLPNLLLFGLVAVVLVPIIWPF
ncbi:SLC13 family permease [Glutamicibacter uratoxydans]|nr:SLC13 family permease [Glutamicibacter uratoxydans]